MNMVNKYQTYTSERLIQQIWRRSNNHLRFLQPRFGSGIQSTFFKLWEDSLVPIGGVETCVSWGTSVKLDSGFS